MAEYIEREALLKVVSGWRILVKDLYDCGYDDCIAAIEDTVSDAPAADVEPVRRGEWICVADYGESEYKCTNCHDVWYLDEGTPIENGMYYCPNCGAKMEEYKSDIT